ncbi:leukocyte elastase inhibitor C-like [Lingula anatina]|uniref:Leukocyte elastase inhibitor C-like n=1 Tax=Lingula anatina TaxID=7574 RepID=A0A1S3HDT1_LINAN|nr:leukocyte elastase inhibitor C-like [Lingula anatina]|eukprot:XP_013384198.1 leukocyte elastase inhibitor C-like [Lingula anatina]
MRCFGVIVSVYKYRRRVSDQSNYSPNNDSVGIKARYRMNRLFIAFTVCLVALVVQAPKCACTSLTVEESVHRVLNFSTTVYSKLASSGSEGNFIFSPFSIWSSLVSMVYNCVTGQAGKELASFLGVSYYSSRQNQETLSNYIKESFSRQQVDMHVVNQRLSVDFTSSSCANSYRLQCKKVQGQFFSANFSDDESREWLGDVMWSYLETDDAKSVFEDDQFKEASTNYVLVDAIRLAQSAALRFGYSRQSIQTFRLDKNQTVKVTYIEAKKGSVYYTGLPDYKAIAIAIPFASGYMVIIRPDDPDGLESVAEVLPELTLTDPAADWKLVRVDGLIFPKIDFGLDRSSHSAAELGIGNLTLFSPLAEITSFPDGVYLEDFRHKSLLSVEYNGVVSRGDPELIKDAEVFPEIKVDSPFLFYVKQDHLLLFLGRVLDPSRLQGPPEESATVQHTVNGTTQDTTNPTGCACVTYRDWKLYPTQALLGDQYCYV